MDDTRYKVYKGMKIVNGSNQHSKGLPWPVVTIGNFDGAHRGHQAVFRKVVQMAQEKEGTSVVLTFQPHPIKILSPTQDFGLLVPHHKKVEAIANSGIDYLIFEPFTKELSALPAKDFILTILVNHLEAKSIYVGSGFRFGQNRSGTAETLKAMGDEMGFKLNLIDPIQANEEVISSSRIRKLIQEGHVEEASKLLGQTYAIQGIVVEGLRRGNTLGFPTANLDPGGQVIPALGVYAARVFLSGETYDGIVHVGRNPTFGRSILTVETHLFNFNREIYGEYMEVGFIRRIRDEISFPSADELISQIRRDVRKARTILAETST